MVVAIERLDDDSLRELSRRTDQLGVLSVYVNTDRRQEPDLQSVAIDLRNRFRELQQRIADDAGSGRSREVRFALERLWPQIERLASPTASGRSRVAFAALESDWILGLESAMPVANRVVLDDGPFIHPLLEMLDEGRAAGIVIVSAEEARLLDWRAGILQEVDQMEQEYVEAPHERAGQIGGGPAGQYNTPLREQRQARERDRTERFLDQVIAVAAELADERGWERILVSATEHLTELAISRFPQALRDKVFTDTRGINRLDEGAIAEAVTEWVHEQHAERERQLLNRVRDAAGSGIGALGLSEVAAALNSGRVAHLVYDPEVRYVGTVGTGGALYAGEEVGPDGQPGSPDSRLTERLVERALETRARVSPVEGAAEGALSDAAGIAALLRW